MKDNETPEVKITHTPHETVVTQEQMLAGTPKSPVWPRDQYGMTSGLRRELARAAGRINGDPRKLEVFIETLKVGGQWAKDRMEVQAQVKEKSRAAAMKREEDAQTAVDEKRKTGPAQETDDERRARQFNAGVGSAAPNKS